jgi:hypothetical protein
MVHVFVMTDTRANSAVHVLLLSLESYVKKCVVEKEIAPGTGDAADREIAYVS